MEVFCCYSTLKKIEQVQYSIMYLMLKEYINNKEYVIYRTTKSKQDDF